MTTILYFIPYTCMISFERLREEFKKNKLDIDKEYGHYVVEKQNILFIISGCYISIIKTGLKLGSLSIKFTTLVDPDSATQVVGAVIEGNNVLTNVDSNKKRLMLSCITDLISKFALVKSTLYIIRLPDKSLSYRLILDTKVGINDFKLFLSCELDVKTVTLTLTDISLLTSPWHVGETICKCNCRLNDITTTINDECLLILQAKNFFKVKLDTKNRIKFYPQALKYLNLISSSTVKIHSFSDIIPRFRFYLAFDYTTRKHKKQYCSILSPNKSDQPIVLYTQNSEYIVDYYIYGIDGSDVSDVIKFISSDIFNPNTELCLMKLFGIANDNLELPEKIVSNTNTTIVLVDATKKSYIYIHSRSVQYLDSGLPSGIEFLLETVLDGESGKTHYNIISNMVESMYDIPPGDIRGICNWFVSSRYGQVSNCVLDF